MNSQDVWERMRVQLIPFFEDEVRIVMPDTWSNKYEEWFKEIEVEAFRESLRYNTEELKTRLNKKDAVIIFLALNECPEGVILGYPAAEDRGGTFYLDTVAIKTRGRGIGRIIFDFIIQWAKLKGYNTIALDTEVENETGMPLQKFYETIGFVVQRIEDDGNITMTLTL